MLDRLLEVIAPHICCSCGKETALICKYCEYDIISERFAQCVMCLRPSDDDNLCTHCRQKTHYDSAWVVGDRSAGLKKLIDLYKFGRTIAAADVIARLLDAVVPQLPLDTIVTYIPTIASHRRQRGYDHMRLVAQKFAKRRGLASAPLLVRQTTLPQRGSSGKERLIRQIGAFKAAHVITSPVLLLDDIYTTGGTITAGAYALRDVSSALIFVGIIARQPLD